MLLVNDWLFTLAFGVAEFALSPRVLAVAFFAPAAVLAAAPWLRPALSPDLASLNLPLRAWAADAPDADDLLYGPRVVRPVSVGAAVLVVVAAAALVTAWRPRFVGPAAGVVLAAAVATNMVVALNFPALIERLDHEYEQRVQMTETAGDRRVFEDAVAARENGRVGPWGVVLGDEQRGDPGRGWVYLVYGWWLVVLSASGVLVGTPGPVPARAAWLAGWAAAGLALGAAACAPRLLGELAWHDAIAQEGRGDPGAAAAALDRSAGWFPELGRLERAWLLRGKLDYQRRVSSPAATAFRVYQLAREKRPLRAVAYSEDLPWTVRRVTDYRIGWDGVPGGPERGLQAGWLGTGIPGRRNTQDKTLSPVPGAYPLIGRGFEGDEARQLLGGLLASQAGNEPAVRHLAARVWTDAGLDRYLTGPRETEAGRVYAQSNRNLPAAELEFARAEAADPYRLDAAYYRTLLTARLDPSDPAAVKAAAEPFLARAAEKPLQADLLSEIGDAYLSAGQLPEARKYFVESFDLYNVPEQFKNYRAQRRLGGL